jgi:serine protease Do
MVRCTSSPLRLRFALVLGLVAGGFGVARAQETPASLSELPAVFKKQVPEGPKDLLEIQKHVQALVKKLQPATVGLKIGAAQGSGVIISKEGHVLTAGHVSGTPGREAIIVLADGRKLKGKTLGRNGTIDSGLVQITEKAEFPYVDMGNSGELKNGDWCMAIGHPGGVKPGRSPVVRLGRVLFSDKSLVRSDCALVGGDSGGPLFDMHGKVIGIHSRIGPFITANIHVPVDTYRETWDKLAAAEEWGSGPFFGSKQADVYMGVMLEFDKKNGKIKVIAPNSPAERAGLKVDDVIAQIDGKAVASQDEVNSVLRRRRPNDEVTLQVLRGEESLTIKLKLEKRPTGS